MNNTGVKTFWKIERFNWYDGELKKDFEQTFENLISDEGLEHLLDVLHKGGTAITAWKVALFESNTTIDGSETYAVPVYTESTVYDEANRVAWTPGTISTTGNVSSVDNSASQASFTFNGSVTIYGGALVGGGTGAATKGDTAGGGTLYAAAQFSSPVGVISGTVVKVQVTSTAQDTAIA